MKPHATRPDPRAHAIVRPAATLALLLGLAACATKGDIRDLRGEVNALANRQASALADLETMVEANQDSISGQSDVLFQLRGDVLQELIEIQEQLLTLQELTGQSQRSLASLRDRIEMQRTMLATAAAEDDSTEAETPAGDGEGPETLYEATLQLFNRGSNNTARRGFEQFMQAYPNHELAADANYYLSDILVQEERLDEAIDGFLRIPELYPTSPRVPDALYRAGILHAELESFDEARTLLERVVNSYPDSNTAGLAEERLRELP